MYRLKVEHHYSKYYPKEHAKDSNYFEIAFNTIEKANQYVNHLYNRTKEHCVKKPVQLSNWGWVLQTQDYVSKEKRLTEDEIKKYEQITRQDIEMFTISVWYYTKYY